MIADDHEVKHEGQLLANSQDSPSALIAECLFPFAIRPSAELAASIGAYTQLLLRWNQKISLTSITEPREIFQKHFGESMFAAQAIPMDPGYLMDIGSGAGFPGLALKLAVPRLEVILVESNLKKSAFLSEVIRSLHLTGVRVLAQRLENLRGWDELVDYVTARAVRADRKLLAGAQHLLGNLGRLVLWMSAEDSTRIRKTPGWNWREPIPIPLSRNRVLQCGMPIVS